MSSDVALGSLWCFQPQEHQTSSGSTNSFKRMGLPVATGDFVYFASQSYNNLHETITIYSITCQTSLERNQLQTSFLGTNPWKIANQSVTTKVGLLFCLLLSFLGPWGRNRNTKQMHTPPKFNIAPEKWWLEDYCPFWDGNFSRAMLNFQGVHVGDAISVGVVCSQRIRHPKESFFVLESQEDEPAFSHQHPSLSTLPETKIAPENRSLEKRRFLNEIPITNHHF